LLDAIVASSDLADGLAADPTTRPDGFVVEGHIAGGHNAPPRGPRRLDARGQPIYDERDVVDSRRMVELGLPFWMAGGYGTPAALRRAVSMGAAGVQVGTVFALCRESGMERGLKERVLRQLAHGDVHVRTDPRASPTGFPFKIVELDGTLSDDAVYADRPRLCDLGVLRTPYRKPDGDVGYRCPAEPIAIYAERRGGRRENTEGRRCLCNGLLATAGFAQSRAGDYQEPAIVTAGVDFTAVRELMGRTEGRYDYSAADVVAYLMGTV
jgi:NAD(P)H-dependent flavin oxidoreductase YrpB (nitropropane dioxygenase family)